MPTTIIKTLGNGGSTNGYDYGDFNAFAAAVPANLVTADEQWILEVYATHGEIALTTTQTISGKTTDATRNIIIRAAAGQSFSDHANKATNALRYNDSNGAAITNNSNAGWLVVNDFASVSRIEGLQFRGTNTAAMHTLLRIADTGVIDKCIVDCAVLAYQNGAIRCGRFINSVGYARSNVGDTKILVRLPWNGASSACVGSTLYSVSGTATAIAQSGAGAVISNCAIFGFSTALSNAGAGGTFSPTYCATNLSGIGGSNNVESLTASSQFEDLTTTSFDFRAKTGGALINAGSRAQTYTGDLDILKQSRSTTTPTIGAFEYGAGGGGGSTDATLTGATLTATTSISAGALTGGSVINATLAGSTLTATTSISAGAIAGTSSGSFLTSPMENNTGSGVLASTAVVWTWVQGEIGTAPTSLTHGSGTTNASGVLTASGLPSGAGYLLVATSDRSGVYYQAGTIS